MLTKEQIKNLKKGDPLIIHCKFNHVDYDGDFWMDLDNSTIWFSPSCVSLPGEPEEKPKHDPCRLFREGDKVRVVEHKGRNCTGCELGLIGEIAIDEGEDDPIHGIGVDFEDGSAVYIDPAYLELVAPVEELEQYSVVETMSHDGWQIVRDGLPLAIYDTRRHPHAKEAAEAERDRLNAEYRKEHPYD